MILATIDAPGSPAPPRAAGVERFLAAARRGDREATERLLLELLPRVRNLVRYLVRGDADVDDIAQEALSIVFRKLDSYRADGPFTAWVDRIVARGAFAHRRKVVDRQEVALSAADISNAHGSSHAERTDDYLARRALVRQLDTLPQEQRDALVMHHVLGMSVPEIAAEISAPEETIRSRLRLGRARLRALVERIDGQEGS